MCELGICVDEDYGLAAEPTLSGGGHNQGSIAEDPKDRITSILNSDWRKPSLNRVRWADLDE